jgi:hypothetical protein
MIDTKIVFTIAFLLGTLAIGGKPPAGGVPIPQQSSGVLSLR